MSKILNKAVQVDPVGVVYNFKGSMVDEWVYNLLTNKFNVDGIEVVKTNVVRSGREPEIAVYVFMRTSSRNIRSNTSRIPEHLRKRMDDGVYTADETLKKALLPLCRNFKLGTTRGLVFCKLDIFKVIGSMLATDPRSEEIRILEINTKMKNDFVLTVLKRMKFVDESAQTSDKYSNIINQLER